MLLRLSPASRSLLHVRYFSNGSIDVFFFILFFGLHFAYSLCVSRWNGVRDVAFALEHGMSVTEGTLAVCGPNVAQQDFFVSQTSGSARLQNQYLVAATMRACFDNLQVRIESLRRWLSTLLVSMDSQQDRAQSCLFRVITVLTCLSSGNQENVLDLAIKEEHKQHVVFGLARYSSVVMKDANGGAAAASAASPTGSLLEAPGTNSTPK